MTLQYIVKKYIFKKSFFDKQQKLRFFINESRNYFDNNKLHFWVILMKNLQPKVIFTFILKKMANTFLET